jgi:hypothetical protein
MLFREFQKNNSPMRYAMNQAASRDKNIFGRIIFLELPYTSKALFFSF